MAKIVVFGDSIAWGSFDPEHGGWVQRLWVAACARPGGTRLSESINYSSVFNLGIGGEVVSGVLRRFDVEAPARQPDVIVIAIGINDASHEGSSARPIDEFVADYEALVTKAKALVADVVLVTPTNVDESRPEHDWRNDDIAQYVEAVTRIGERFDLPVVDVFGALLPGDLAPDGIHPGSQGHQKLFDLISPVVFAKLTA